MTRLDLSDAERDGASGNTRSAAIQPNEHQEDPAFQ